MDKEEKPKQRSWIVASLRGFHSAKFHDKRLSRGGAKNRSREYANESADEVDDLNTHLDNIDES